MVCLMRAFLTPPRFGCPIPCPNSCKSFERPSLACNLCPPPLPRRRVLRLRVRHLYDPSTSPAFRRILLSTMRRHGLKINKSPYSADELRKKQAAERRRRAALEGEAGAGFTLLEIRHMVRYIEDSCESKERNGTIDYEEFVGAFRRARRAQAAAKYEKPGRLAVFKLEKSIKVNKLSVREWFDSVDCAIHKDGYLTHAELTKALMDLKVERRSFEAARLLAIEPEAGEPAGGAEAAGAFEAFKLAHEVPCYEKCPRNERGAPRAPLMSPPAFRLCLFLVCFSEWP